MLHEYRCHDDIIVKQGAPKNFETKPINHRTL